jgi:glutamine amidotransferase
VIARVAVVDTGRGNLLSIANALDLLGADVVICAEPDALDGAERIVLPGVGSFRAAMDSLHERGMPAALDAHRAAGTPVLGVCLGMQLVTRWSDEGGGAAGLGWIDADVRRIDAPGLRVPHTGWNDTAYVDDSPLFDGLPPNPELYYTHSYRVVADDDAIVDATCDHGGAITAAIRSGNVAAVQFHPEKSQDHGLTILDNFLRWKPSC